MGVRMRQSWHPIRVRVQANPKGKNPKSEGFASSSSPDQGREVETKVTSSAGILLMQKAYQKALDVRVSRGVEKMGVVGDNPQR